MHGFCVCYKLLLNFYIVGNVNGDQLSSPASTEQPNPQTSLFMSPQNVCNVSIENTLNRRTIFQII